MATGFDQRHKNDIAGLLWIHSFGWLRSAELGRLMWKKDKHARTRADRVIRGWIDRALVIERKLPDGAGRAFVLSEAGARLLAEAGHPSAKSGKDWGETKGLCWSPNSAWRHDLIAAGVLVRLFEADHKIIPEKTLRRENPGLLKIPDGLAVKGSVVVCLEVESARKTGQTMRDLTNAIIAANQGHYAVISNFRPNAVAIAYVEDAKDDRGHRLDHRARVTAAIQKAADQDIQIFWLPCELAGCGVAKVSVQKAQVPADRASRVLKILNANGWCEDESGCLVAIYGEFKAVVWEDESMGWSYQVEGIGISPDARLADNKTVAMRGCASLIAAT